MHWPRSRQRLESQRKHGALAKVYAVLLFKNLTSPEGRARERLQVSLSPCLVQLLVLFVPLQTGFSIAPSTQPPIPFCCSLHPRLAALQSVSGPPPGFAITTDITGISGRTTTSDTSPIGLILRVMQ